MGLGNLVRSPQSVSSYVLGGDSAHAASGVQATSSVSGLMSSNGVLSSAKKPEALPRAAWTKWQIRDLLLGWQVGILCPPDRPSKSQLRTRPWTDPKTILPSR